MVSMAKMLSSESMLDKMARVIANASRKKSVFKSPTYKVANAEQTELPSGSADLVTIMYGFHEIPYHGRQRILYEARRILAPGGTLAIVDISKDYEPSPSMLAGEPYVLEYQQNIDRQLEGMSGFQDLSCKAVIPGHVTVWMLRKTGDDGQIIWRQQVPSSTVLDRMESFV
jgi:SAM-dependent methyltransferase